MRPQRFDLIAFDWDGTLFDSTALIARSIQRAAVDIGLPEPEFERAKYVIGLGLRDALEHVRDLPTSTGVVNMSPQDHVGLDQRARVMVQIKDGAWTLIK